MDESTLIGTLVIGIGSLISILVPILKVSAKITHMQSSMNYMLENDKRRDERINNHGRELDMVVRQVDKNGVTIANHETRITKLEEKLKD